MHFINQIKKILPCFQFKDLNRAIAELRVIKSPAEIEIMRECARISSLAHIEVLRSAKPGMYEWELEALFEHTIKRLGGQGFGYEPIIPSVPKWYDSHYSENSRKIEDGDIVMPDVGGEYQYYVVDISATFPINGKFTPEQKRLNRIICAVEEAMRKVFRPGIRSIDMETEVQELVAKQGIDMEKEGVYRIEANHWIGLDVHDVIGAGIPSRTTILKPGMVLACDPAIKIRDENGNVVDGVKIENTVLITEDGCENLTHLVPRTVEEIEKVMAEEGIHDFLNKKNYR
jgi:Xaa-Pro aminopeptidase